MEYGSYETIATHGPMQGVFWMKSRSKGAKIGPQETFSVNNYVLVLEWWNLNENIQHEEGKSKVPLDVTWEIKDVLDLSTQLHDHRKGSWTQWSTPKLNKHNLFHSKASSSKKL
jgi:hypothetical protein